MGALLMLPVVLVQALAAAIVGGEKPATQRITNRPAIVQVAEPSFARTTVLPGTIRVADESVVEK
jgi:hypothetical protein